MIFKSRRPDRMVQKDNYVYIMISKSRRLERMVQRDNCVHIMFFLKADVLIKWSRKTLVLYNDF